MLAAALRSGPAWLCLGVLIGLPLAGCEPQPAGERPLRVGLESELRGFDPLRTAILGFSTLSVAATLFDTLITMDEAGNIQPALALDLTPDAQRLRWTARLRPDVRFHDGSQFDAAAVAFHFNRLLNPANDCACRSVIAPISHVAASAPDTVEFHLHEPWESLPAVLAEPSLVSLVGSPKALLDESAQYHRRPVGTGAFIFAEWRVGDRFLVRRNPDYWNAAAISLESIEFRILPDQQARLASVRSGDVDIIWTVHAGSVARAAQDPSLRISQHIGNGAPVLMLNTKAQHLRDLRIREALAYASDMKMYAAAVSEGKLGPTNSPFGPDGLYTCNATGYPDFDPVRAKQLIADYARPVRLEFIHSATPRGQLTAQIMQQFWANVGIKADLVPLEQVQLVERVIRGDYQIGVWRIRDSIDPAIDLYALFHSGSQFNVAQFEDDPLDRMLEQLRQERNQDKRSKLYCDTARRIAKTLPLLYLSQNGYFAIYKDNVGPVPPLRGGILDVRYTKFLSAD